MLCLTRKRGESIMIDDQIEVTVLEIQGNRVRIGINAPQGKVIKRKEIWVPLPQPAADPAAEPMAA